MNQQIYPLNITAQALNIRRPLRRASQLMSLEQRFMFDGAVADAAHAATPDNAPPPVPPAVTIRVAEPSKDDGKKEVVLVDTSLSNYKSLEAGVRDGVGIVEFDGSKDGLAQIAQWAATQNGLDAIHILSHGSEGLLTLGSMQLNEAALGSATVQTELAQLGQALTADGDLLLYGCDVATGNSAFLADLARATGADVAASTDPTGAAHLGGNWTLEAHVGDIDTRELTLTQYDGMLLVPTTTVIGASLSADTGASGSDFITKTAAQTISGTLSTNLVSGERVEVSYDGGNTWSDATSYAVGSSLWSTTTTLAGSNTFIARVSNSDSSSTGYSHSYALDTTAPATTAVAVPANATYYTGDALDFTVNFDEAITVDTTGGTPRIAVTVGVATRYATYVSGSGTSALTFRYTVVNGDIDADGITVGALSANGGGIKDGAGNDAALTLNSVGSTAGIDVDGSNPSITNVGASTADGSYGAGQTVTITVDFSSAVTVDTTHGTPTLALDGGGSASYTGGSGGTTLTFSYVVGAGQDSADLDYSSTAALALNGATIIETGGAHQAASVTLATPGTAGSLGANKDLVIDTTAPANTVAGAAFSADTGSSGSDFITKTATQTISGTLASNLAAGENVYVSLDNGASWALATASTGANTWSLAGQTLTGSGTLKVRIVDDAGNNGTAYAQAYVLDTTAPTTDFSGVALSADTGASNSDLITKTAAQTISATLSGAPAAGDEVYGSLDNGATWTDVTSQVSGTTLTWTGVTLASSNTLQLRVIDAAGNIGPTTSKAYVLDTSSPATTVASVTFSADTGASSTDFITNTAAQTVSGTLSANLAADESVLVSLDNGATWSIATATVGSNNWSLAGQTLSASDTLRVKVVDVAGNDGAVLAQAYVYNTEATVPVVDTLTTNSTTPVLTGSATLAAGETMTVTVGGATYSVVPVAGAWSLDLASAVPLTGTLNLVLNRQYSVEVAVTDLAGNVSNDNSTNELTVGVLPTSAPPLPVETQIPPPLVTQPNVEPVTQSVPVTEIIGGPAPSLQQDTLSSILNPNVFVPDFIALSSPFDPITGSELPRSSDTLMVNQRIADFSVNGGSSFSMQVPSDAFSSVGVVELSAMQADGKPLPGWLKFNSRTARFEGTPPLAFEGTLSFKLVARDAQGHIAVQVFKIIVSKDGQGNKGADLQRGAVEPVGRASLSEQMRTTRAVGAERLAVLSLSTTGVRPGA